MRAKGRLGPGLVFFFTAMGPGTFMTSAVAGATYGYQLLWVLAPALVFRYVWVTAAASYVLVTRESPKPAATSSHFVERALAPTVVNRPASDAAPVAGARATAGAKVVRLDPSKLDKDAIAIYEQEFLHC